MIKIGQTESEKDAQKLLACRQITQEVINFGVSQEQIVKIIKLLALELEDVNLMKKIIASLTDTTEATANILSAPKIII